MKKKIIPFIIGALMLTGCDDLFSPAIENFQGVENMYNDAEYARGILHNVYSLIPGYYDNSEYGTDDAVTNQPSNVYLQMATGAWTTSHIIHRISGPIPTVPFNTSTSSWSMWEA